MLTRTSTKRQQLLDAGAAHVIATEEADLVADVMRITEGQGARVAFDPVGGPDFAKLISALAFGGIVYVYGLLSTGVTALPVLAMIAKVVTVKAHNIWLTSGDETRRKAAIEFVLKGLENGALKPIIDRVSPSTRWRTRTGISNRAVSLERSSRLCERAQRQRRQWAKLHDPGRWRLEPPGERRLRHTWRGSADQGREEDSETLSRKKKVEKACKKLINTR